MSLLDIVDTVIYYCSTIYYIFLFYFIYIVIDFFNNLGNVIVY